MIWCTVAASLLVLPPEALKHNFKKKIDAYVATALASGSPALNTPRFRELMEEMQALKEGWVILHTDINRCEELRNETDALLPLPAEQRQ